MRTSHSEVGTFVDGRSRHARIAGSVLTLAVLASIVLATPASSRAVAPTLVPVERASTTFALAAASPIRMDLYAPRDFVSQTNLLQCVGASMQMMLNMIRPTDDRTAATQLRLFQLALAFGDRRAPYGGGSHGASAQGWAAGLTSSGVGPYRVVAVATLDEAVTIAARAIRQTNKPVGLLVWQGKHAWVMSGFEATADPTLYSAAQITAVRVLDPLYPRPGGAWGPTPAPDSRLTVGRLADVFVPYRPQAHNVALRNRFVLVLPYEAPPPERSLRYPA